MISLLLLALSSINALADAPFVGARASLLAKLRALRNKFWLRVWCRSAARA